MKLKFIKNDIEDITKQFRFKEGKEWPKSIGNKGKSEKLIFQKQ